MSHMDDIRTFKVIGCSGELPVTYLSTNKSIRDKQYKHFAKEGITLVPYADYKRTFLNKRDLKVFCKPWWIVFEYKGVVYKLIIGKGAVIDEASIPWFFRFGLGTAHNQYVSIPSGMHDVFFAMKLFSFDDSNNLFSAALRWKNTPKSVIGRLMMGVRSVFGKHSYRDNNPDTHWLKGFVKLEIVHS